MAMTDTEIGKLLSKARLKKRIAQKAVAEKIGVNQSYISGVETGRNPVTKTVLENLESWGADEATRDAIFRGIASRGETKKGISLELVQDVVRIMETPNFRETCTALADTIRRDPQDIMAETIYQKLLRGETEVQVRHRVDDPGDTEGPQLSALREKHRSGGSGATAAGGPIAVDPMHDRLADEKKLEKPA